MVIRNTRIHDTNRNIGITVNAPGASVTIENTYVSAKVTPIQQVTTSPVSTVTQSGNTLVVG